MIKKLGNNTKINPHKNLVPKYITYPITAFHETGDDGELEPIISDQDVMRGRDFVNENHK